LLGDVEVEEAAVCTETVDGSFELPHVAEDVLGNEKRDPLRNAQPFLLGLVEEDRDPRLQIGDVHRSDESPLHPPHHALREFQMTWRLIARNHNLLTLIDQRFKRVAKLLLKIESVLQKLDIVDE